MAPSRWWDKDIHADRRDRLIVRNRVKTALRTYFLSQDFTEVECGALVVSPGNETHLHAFATTLLTEDGDSRPLYLHTSPEFAAKKLLAAGEKRIFEFARTFRNRERGPLHAPEFTMLEWYRADVSFEAAMADAVALMRLAAEMAGARALFWRDSMADPHQEPEYLTVSGAFAKHAKIDLLPLVGDREEFAAAARTAGVRVGWDDTWSDIFSRLMAEKIEPHLGRDRATLLFDYPISEAALARASAKDLRVAERFELYACGVELANGFSELTDAAEQRTRFEAQMALKARLYGERYPLDEVFLAALAQMPDAAGAAMGFDRLVMLCVGASKIDDVLWTPAPGA
jgi:elongation factor P--(R)-beta-lysine ligase